MTQNAMPQFGLYLSNLKYVVWNRAWHQTTLFETRQVVIRNKMHIYWFIFLYRMYLTTHPLLKRKLSHKKES